MKIAEIVHKILEARTLTAAQETELNHLLWSRLPNPQEAEALTQLAEVLQNGTVKYAR